MKEERWRMICEGLGLDYDQIVSDVPEKDDTSSALRAPSPQGEGMECASEQDKLPMQEAVDGLMQKVDLQKEKQDRDNLFLLAMYAEGRLAVDIEAGMKVDPMKLWGILDALKKIKDSTLSPE